MNLGALELQPGAHARFKFTISIEGKGVEGVPLNGEVLSSVPESICDAQLDCVDGQPKMIAAVILFLGLIVGLSIAWLGPIAALGVTALASIRFVFVTQDIRSTFCINQLLCRCKREHWKLCDRLRRSWRLTDYRRLASAQAHRSWGCSTALGFGWLLLHATLAYVSLVV